MEYTWKKEKDLLWFGLKRSGHGLAIYICYFLVRQHKNRRTNPVSVIQYVVTVIRQC